MTDYVSPNCNDQFIHNILVWSNMLSEIDNIVVWDYFDGPVKTLDVGYLQDEFGRVINEKGLPYCVAHQFKPGRNADFVERLNHLFPLFPHPMRIVTQFNTVQGITCSVDECRQVKVHDSTQIMINQNIHKARRSPIPALQRILNLQGPIRNLTGVSS
jgi:hypothetical protein